MKIPSRTLSTLKPTVPLAAALALNLLPPARATSIEGKSAFASPREIESLVASSGAIHPGTAVKLRWSAPGATLISLAADNGSRPDRVSGDTFVVDPTKTATDTFTAMNVAGNSVKKIAVPAIGAAAAPALPDGVVTGPETSGLSQPRR